MIRLIIVGLLATGASIMLYLGLSPKKEPEAKKIFTSNEMVWFGLDFTKTHFVGSFDHGFGANSANGYDLRTKWIPAWNNLIVKEQYNFDLRRCFRKRYVYYDIASVDRLNDKLDPEQLLNYNETKIGKELIPEMVKKYTSSEKQNGLGLVFIIENFNKNTKKAGLYVTFFDIETRKVLLCEYMSGNPVGFGLRNYWAGAVKDILNWVDFYEYRKWKNRYYDNPWEEEDDKVSILQNSNGTANSLVAR